MTEWQPIETAPKGGGAELVTDPAWVDPPAVLLFCDDVSFAARWDWYYAEGGAGHDGRSAWIICPSGERVADHFDGEPTHWMPLPEPPK